MCELLPFGGAHCSLIAVGLRKVSGHLATTLAHTASVRGMLELLNQARKMLWMVGISFRTPFPRGVG